MYRDQENHTFDQDVSHALVPYEPPVSDKSHVQKRHPFLLRGAALALCFCLRRTVGSFVPGWFLGLIPAGIYQSISLSGVEGTARSLVAQILPGLLPVIGAERRYDFLYYLTGPPAVKAKGIFFTAFWPPH